MPLRDITDPEDDGSEAETVTVYHGTEEDQRFAGIIRDEAIFPQFRDDKIREPWDLFKEDALRAVEGEVSNRSPEQFAKDFYEELVASSSESTREVITSENSDMLSYMSELDMSDFNTGLWRQHAVSVSEDESFVVSNYARNAGGYFKLELPFDALAGNLGNARVPGFIPLEFVSEVYLNENSRNSYDGVKRTLAEQGYDEIEVTEYETSRRLQEIDRNN